MFCIQQRTSRLAIKLRHAMQLSTVSQKVHDVSCIPPCCCHNQVDCCDRSVALPILGTSKAYTQMQGDPRKTEHIKIVMNLIKDQQISRFLLELTSVSVLLFTKDAVILVAVFPKYAPNELAALEVNLHFTQYCQILETLAIFLWFLLWLLLSIQSLEGCCGCTIFAIPPQIKNSGVQVRLMWCQHHTCCWLFCREIALSSRLGSHLISGVAGTTFHFDLSLCVVPVMPNSSTALKNYAFWNGAWRHWSFLRKFACTTVMFVGTIFSRGAIVDFSGGG